MTCYCAACGFEIPGPDECEHCRPHRTEVRALRRVAIEARRLFSDECPHDDRCSHGPEICPWCALSAALAALDAKPDDSAGLDVRPK